MIETWLGNLGNIIQQNFWLGLIIAFAAGILTFFTPCALSSVPMVVAYVGGTGATKRRAMFYSIFVALGETVIFVILGVVGALIGQTINLGGIWTTIFYIIMGILMALMSFELFGLTSLLSKNYTGEIKTSKKGIWGAILVGMTGALFATPCATPVLSAMLAYTSIAGGGWIQSILLMVMYSVGFNLLLVVCGTSFGFATAMKESDRFESVANVIKIVLGVIIYIFAIYLIVTALYI